MGSEHSTQSNLGSRGLSLDEKLYRRQHTLTGDGNDENRPGSISPGPSVCSDTDLPYISYTVNRPIGDSPKLTNKQIVATKKTNRKLPKQQKRPPPSHNIVVVKTAQQSGQNLDKDPDVLRLQSIPMFLPIMRATLNLPAARDPEVLERLDPAPLHKLCVKYQSHLTNCANSVVTEQNTLTQKIREIDVEIIKLVNSLTDRQKKYAKYAEKLGRVSELSHQLNRCHMLLNQTLESMETLNNYLDIEDRLEPFVWTTG